MLRDTRRRVYKSRWHRPRHEKLNTPHQLQKRHRCVSSFSPTSHVRCGATAKFQQRDCPALFYFLLPWRKVGIPRAKKMLGDRSSRNEIESEESCREWKGQPGAQATSNQLVQPFLPREKMGPHTLCEPHQHQACLS